MASLYYRKGDDNSGKQKNRGNSTKLSVKYLDEEDLKNFLEDKKSETTVQRSNEVLQRYIHEEGEYASKLFFYYIPGILG